MNHEVSVLKFGSSVLHDTDDLHAAVHDVYREVRLGRRVVAVVSALGGTTDRLEATARALSPDGRSAAYAALLATGEAHAAAAFTLAVEAAGLPCAHLTAAQLGLRTEGERDVAWSGRLPELGAGEALYVRVLQRDGGAAWSSPFFFEARGPR